MSGSRRLLALVLVAAAGCKSWAPAKGLTWEVVAPERVRRGESFTFRVQARTAEGRPAEGMMFLYAIDWPTVNGSKHKAMTFTSNSQTAKGKPGNGLLRIYTYDDAGETVQVAQAEFVQE